MHNETQRLLLFDIDGTLVDSQNEIVEAQTQALAAHGYPPPSRETALSVVGLSLAEAFVALVGPAGPVEDLATAYKTAWADLRARPGYCDPLYPGAAELVFDLARARHNLLGIVTGKSRAGVARLLAAQGWANLFATIQTADTHPSKPNPSMVEVAMAETGVAARHAIVIGDTTYDMTMATRAGVQAIGVAWGYHPRQALLTSGATTIADSFDHLRILLDAPTLETA